MGFLLFGFGRYLDPPFPLSLPVVGKIEELMTIREVCDLGWAPTKRKSDNLSLLSHFLSLFRHRQKTTKVDWKSDNLSLFCRFFCRFFRIFSQYLWFSAVRIFIQEETLVL